MFERIKRLWKLSELEAYQLRDIPSKTGKSVSVLVDADFKKEINRIQKATFIPRIKVSPVDEIVNEKPE